MPMRTSVSWQQPHAGRTRRRDAKSLPALRRSYSKLTPPRREGSVYLLHQPIEEALPGDVYG
jgi:hypothetical protein